MSKEREKGWRLSEDLTAEILVRFPVETLLLLKRVCKSWFVLIKSPNFVKMHLELSSTRNKSILIFSKDDYGEKLELTLRSYESLKRISFLDKEEKIPWFHCCWLRFCGTCNGLLCISDLSKDIKLWNPATEGVRINKELPLPPFGPCKEWSYMSIGFGFDSIRNDYKVVAIVRDCKIGRKSVGIYNLSTNSWRKVNLGRNFLDKCSDLVYGPPVSGALHWMVKGRGQGDYIISFNTSTEEFGAIELPDDLLVKCGREVKLKLTWFNESLALFVWSHPSSEALLVNLWVMHEHGVAESWTKQVNIGPMTGIKRPLLVWKDESILLENSRGQLVSCDLDSLDAPEMIGSEIDVSKVIDLMIYYESLVSVA